MDSTGQEKKARSASTDASQKPSLTLLPAGIPTLEALVEFYEHLSGQSMTPEEIEELKQMLSSLETSTSEATATPSSSRLPDLGPQPARLSEADEQQYRRRPAGPSRPTSTPSA
jgi:hypothetical protein